jgi:hypothetical protein
MGESVYLVPLVDVNWVQFAPMDAKKGYLAEPPPVEQCAEEVDRCIDEFRNLSDGKVVYSVHSGTYCRRAFYEEPFLSHYRRAIVAGGEICLHTHEEIAGKGTRNAEQDHMKRMILDRNADLNAAGIEATSYRGGHFAYMSYLTPFLESLDVLIDFSAAPGFNQPAWDAVWTGAPFSAFYLNRANHLAAPRNGETSKVLEIPLGVDGIGSEPVNQLYTDESTLEDLKRVWATIRGRAATSGQPQFVHLLFHSSSMGRPDVLERFRRFMDHVAKNGARFCNPTEAKAAFDANR